MISEAVSNTGVAVSNSTLVSSAFSAILRSASHARLVFPGPETRKSWASSIMKRRCPKASVIARCSAASLCCFDEMPANRSNTLYTILANWSGPTKRYLLATALSRFFKILSFDSLDLGSGSASARSSLETHPGRRHTPFMFCSFSGSYNADLNCAWRFGAATINVRRGVPLRARALKVSSATCIAAQVLPEPSPWNNSIPV